MKVGNKDFRWKFLSFCERIIIIKL